MLPVASERNDVTRRREASSSWWPYLAIEHIVVGIKGGTKRGGGREIYLSGRQSDRNRLESASGLQAERFRRWAEMRFADEHDMGSQVAITLLVPSVWRSICWAHIVSWRVRRGTDDGGSGCLHIYVLLSS